MSKIHPVVLVCGASDYDNARVMRRVLDAHPIAILVVGNRSGADALAQRWAEDTGTWCFKEPARKQFTTTRKHWQGLLQPDLVLAFRGDDTSHLMVDAALASGIPVEAIHDDDYERPSTQ